MALAPGQVMGYIELAAKDRQSLKESSTMTIKDCKPESSLGKSMDRIMALKAEIDVLAEQLEAEKSALLKRSIRDQVEGYRLGAMTVSRRSKQTWTYSEQLQLQKANIKAMEKIEQTTGAATSQKSEHMVITFQARILLREQVAQ